MADAISVKYEDSRFGNLLLANGLGVATDYLSGYGNIFGNSDLGRGMGTLFSSGVSSVGNTLANNVLKGTTLTEGLGKNAGASLAGAGVGLAALGIGKGINSLGGNSMLSRGIGQGVATGLGTVGGQALGNLFKTGSASNSLTSSINAIKTFNAALKTAQGADAATKAAKMAGVANLAGLGMTVVGSGLQAALGPSKEYGGKYGNITQTMDTVYDAVTAGVNFIPGVGLVISGALALNKGLGNLFGSTSGMTVQDAILGSAFMPAPVKWINSAGAKTTSNFNNLSWQNSEKAASFMGNAFGNLLDKFDKAREEAGKTYGLASRGAYNKALNNLAFANTAWGQIMDMADLNELQNIRSLYMTSINNLRYAQNIQGGWNPIARGKQGMKIFNNATNHNIGMRLLSAAALIDNKQMILSALSGTKVMRPRMKSHRKGEQPVYTEEELRQLAEWNVHLLEVRKQQAEEQARKLKLREEAATKFNLQAGLVLTTMTQQANETPFTGQEYQKAAENLRQEKVEKFHEAEKVGEAALMADLAVSAAPLLLRSFRWAFNKAGLLAKIPKLTELYAPEIPVEVSNYTGKWKNWVERIQPKLTNKAYDSQKLISIGNASKDKAFLYYKSDEFIKRAKNAGFNDFEISLLQKELLDMLNHSLVKSSSSANNGIHAWADAYLDNSGNLYRNATSFEPHVQGFSLEDIISMWDHEFGHVATNMYNSAGRNLGNFMLLVKSRYPMIVKMMKYNESIAPKFKSELENLYNFWHSSDIETKLKQSYPKLSELELKEFINKYLKFSENIKEYIGNSNELRSRALSTLFAALRKGKSAYLYILENSEDLNAARELDNVFESQSLKKYLDNFLNYSVPITTVGGATYVSTK